MKTLIVLLVAVMLVALVVPAQAGGIPIPEGLSVGMSRWAPLVSDVPAEWAMIMGYKVSRKPGPDTPTQWAEFWPWAQANFQLNAAFAGTPQDFMAWRGGGFSEAVKIGSIRKAPIRGGIGYLDTMGVSYFGQVGSIEF
jgi:hypothetical protein